MFCYIYYDCPFFIMLKNCHFNLNLILNRISKFQTFNYYSSCQITAAEHIKHMVQQFCGPNTFPVYFQTVQTKKKKHKKKKKKRRSNIFKVQTSSFQNEMVKYCSQFRNSNWLFFFFFLSRTRFNSFLHSHAHKYTSLELSESIRLPDLHDEF